MNEEPEDIYGVEPTPKAVPEPSTPPPRVGKPIGDGPKIVPSGNSEPLGLEDEVPLSMRPIKDLDVCPNCGASMGSTGEVLCMRCGFDLKTMKQVKVQTGVVEVPAEGVVTAPDGTVIDQRKPMVEPGLGDQVVPFIVATVAGAIMLVGFMVGVRGLFPPAIGPDGEAAVFASISFGSRLLGVLKMLVNVALITACGLGALRFVAFLLGQRVGDWALAAARMLGIAAVLQLTLFIDLKTFSWENTVEFVVQAALLALLSMLGLGIRPKDVATFVGSAAIAYLAIQVGAWMITVLT